SLPPRPHLHSFPTRRSSDLGRSRGFALFHRAAEMGCDDVAFRGFANGEADALRAALTGEKAPGVDALARVEVTRAGPLHDALGRSEEHTSELQSRENLVCRL